MWWWISSEAGEGIGRDEQIGGADGGDAVSEGEAMLAGVDDDEMIELEVDP